MDPIRHSDTYCTSISLCTPHRKFRPANATISNKFMAEMLINILLVQKKNTFNEILKCKSVCWLNVLACVCLSGKLGIYLLFKFIEDPNNMFVNKSTSQTTANISASEQSMQQIIYITNIIDIICFPLSPVVFKE